MADQASSRLPIYILAGAALGLCAGLVVGERAALLEPLGIAYSKMLEISVFPYLICSLLVGLGGLVPERARRLFRASWGPYLIVWVLTLLTIVLLGRFIPASPPPSLLKPETTTAVSDLIDLLIPANIAVALDRNLVPAIVIFAILYSIAIQTVPQKAALLESMDVLRRASVTIWGWIVFLAPVGVFALFASTAGTVGPAVAGELAVYTLLYLFGTCVLGFVVLPLLLSRLIPQSYGDILRQLRPALTLAMVTTLSVAALPFIQRAAEDLCRRQELDAEESGDVVKATLALAYVLGQLGNYFIALFLIYASYSDRVALTPAQWLQLPFMTLLSGIGSPSASVDAVAFLAEWLHLPATTTDLYVETMTITRYGQVALSVMGFAFVTLLVTMVYFGRVRLRLRPIVIGIAATASLFGAVSLGGRMLAATLFPPPNDAAIMARRLDPDLVRSVDATVLKERPADLAPLTGAASLEGILARKHIRIGYGADIIPFSYFNAKGDLVGYDVAAGYRFARDLQVAAEFVPVDWTRLDADLQARRFDIVMAGAYATPGRLQRLSVSDFYLVNPIAFIVRSDRSAEFLSYGAIAARPNLHLAVFRDPVLEPLLRRLFPHAQLTILESYDLLPGLGEIDAAIWTEDQAAAWTAARTGFTAVVPPDVGAPLPFAYLLPPDSPEMVHYVDLWLQLEQNQGIRAAARGYWIEGTPRNAAAPRWNLIDNVIIPLWPGGHAPPATSP